MKNIFICISVFIIFSKVCIASGGPDLYGYTWKDIYDVNGPVYNWIPIENYTTNVEVKLLGDDNLRGPFPVGINFHYYWNDPTLFYVGSNGYISFDHFQLASPFPYIPSTSQPNNFIAAMACDLSFSGGNNPGKCYYWVNNANDSLVVSWLNVPFYSDVAFNNITGSNTFQIILTSVDSSITFQYQSYTGATLNYYSPYISIGIENNSGSIGLQHSTNTYPTAQYAIKYHYPATTNYNIIDAATNWNNNTNDGGIFLNIYQPDTLITNVKNTGNQTTAPFNVFSEVLNSASSSMVSGTLQTNSLNPGQSQTLTQTSTFTPVTTGTYQLNTTTQLNGDAVISNNTRILEMQVIDTSNIQILLSYDDNLPNSGLSWIGDSGGAAVYFIPPFHPCRIDGISYYILSNGNNVNFIARLYADDGAYHAANTLLAEQIVNNAPTGWNNVYLNNPPVINTDGVYAAWQMGGQNIFLGADLTPPISNRTFEVFGNSWCNYRFGDTEDLMINLHVSKPTPAGIATKTTDIFNVNCYPNPVKDKLRLDISGSDINENLNIELLDINGSIIYTSTISIIANNTTHYDINMNTISKGVYTLQLNDDRHLITKKIVKN